MSNSEKFPEYEFDEEVKPLLHLRQKHRSTEVSELALDSAHGIAFHKGLGASIFPSLATPLKNYFDEEYIRDFSFSAYAKSNISVVANGASQAELSRWVGQFFADVPSTSARTSSEATKYYGGEERITNVSGNSLVIAFPGSSSFTAGASYKPEIAVLAALLGGKPTIKWSPGFSHLSKAVAGFPGARAFASNHAYSDAGLFTIQFNGSAGAIRGASMEAVKVLKSIAAGSITKEDITKAVALAKYQALEAGQDPEAGLVSTGSGLVHGGKAFQIDEIGKSVQAVSGDKLKAVCFLTNCIFLEIRAQC
jgi:ubiquinol-cytochrome c reductase core subunit 2